MRKLALGIILVQQVAGKELDFPMLANAFLEAERQIVARHLVNVRDILIRVLEHLAHRQDAAAVTPVHQAQHPALVLVEQTGIDQVRRLPLHGAVAVEVLVPETHLAVNPSRVHHQGEVLELHEVEALSQFQFHAGGIGEVGILEGVNRVPARGADIGNLDRIAEMLVERPYRNQLLGRRIELVSQVHVLDLGILQIGIPGIIGKLVEVVIDVRRDFPQLGTVDRVGVSGTKDMLVAEMVGTVERREHIQLAPVHLHRHRTVCRIAVQDGPLVFGPRPCRQMPSAHLHLDRCVERRNKGGSRIGIGLAGVLIDEVTVRPQVLRLEYLGQIPVQKIRRQRGRIARSVQELAAVESPVLVLSGSPGKQFQLQALIHQQALVVYPARYQMLVHVLVVAVHIGRLVHLVIRHRRVGLLAESHQAAIRLLAVRETVSQAVIQLMPFGRVVRIEQLPQVEGTLRIDVFLFPYMVIVVVVDTLTESRLVLGILAEKVLELETRTVLELEADIAQGIKLYLGAIILIGIGIQVTRLLVDQVEHAEAVVLESLANRVLVTVIEREQAPELDILVLAYHGRLVPLHREALGRQGGPGRSSPVVVQHPGVFRFLGIAGLADIRREARRKLARSPAETNRIDPVAVVMHKVLADAGRIDTYIIREAQGILRGHALGGDADQTAGEIGRKFSRSRLVQHQMIDGVPGNDIQGERPAVVLRSRCRGPVEQDRVVPHVQAPHVDHPAFFHADPRKLGHHLGGIFRLGTGNQLGRSPGSHHVGLLHRAQDRRIGMPHPACRHLHFLQLRSRAFHRHIQMRVLTGHNLDIGNHLRLIRREADLDGISTRRQIERIAPVQTGYRPQGSTFYLHRGKRQGLARTFVGHHALQNAFRLAFARLRNPLAFHRPESCAIGIAPAPNRCQNQA